MSQLELFPTRCLVVACEYQGGEVIQVPNGSGRRDQAALVVNPKGRGVDTVSVVHNLHGIGVTGRTAAEELGGACTSTAARHIGVVGIAPPLGHLIA